LSNFVKACELLSGLYGDTAYECADAYYYYGKALLEMARAEAGVFGNALDGGKDFLKTFGFS
jgi:nuclear autoantigenic sperm protein